ncbi:MAG: DUF4349 domain-containing protein [Erysipelotrichaceae bacterium]|nr:DUF4349 domain-containing protein [Erysipelotrichaceae bacterium]
MKKFFSRMILIVLILALAGCSKKAVDSYYEPDAYYHFEGSNAAPASDSYASYQGKNNGSYTAKPSNQSEYESIKKVIVRTTMNIETYKMDETLSKILNEVKASGGYTQSSNQGKHVYGNESFRRYAAIVLRIPAENYDAFMEAISTSGNVISISTNTDDITEAYYNLQAEIESLKLEEERVKSFYDLAKDIDELLRIEQRLTEIQSQIAQDEATMKNYQLLTDYCTVTIEIQEVTTYTDTSDTFFSRLVRQLKDSANGFVRFLENALFFLIDAFWYILLAAVLLIVCRKLENRFGVIRNFRQKKTERKLEKLEARKVKDTL